MVWRGQGGGNQGEKRVRGVRVGGVEGVGSGIPKLVGSTRNRGNYAELKKAHRGERQQKQGRESGLNGLFRGIPVWKA